MIPLMFGIGLISLAFSCIMYPLSKRYSTREIPEDWIIVAGASATVMLVGAAA